MLHLKAEHCLKGNLLEQFDSSAGFVEQGLKVHLRKHNSSIADHDLIVRHVLELLHQLSPKRLERLNLRNALVESAGSAAV